MRALIVSDKGRYWMPIPCDSVPLLHCNADIIVCGSKYDVEFPGGGLRTLRRSLHDKMIGLSEGKPQRCVSLISDENAHIITVDFSVKQIDELRPSMREFPLRIPAGRSRPGPVKMHRDGVAHRPQLSADSLENVEQPDAGFLRLPEGG